jgi:RNA polymerase sigma-70 factor (ECF subfamily)
VSQDRRTAQPDAEAEQARVEAALAGDAAAMAALVRALRPVVQGEVAAALDRRAGAARGRDHRQELADMMQEIFLALVVGSEPKLRHWEPARGLSLKGFVRMVARQEVSVVLRSGRRSPWREDPTESDALETAAPRSGGHDRRIESRESLCRLVDALRASTDTRGMLLFERLYLEGAEVEAVCAEFGMKRDAVYAWRARLKRKLGQLREELGL